MATVPVAVAAPAHYAAGTGGAAVIAPQAGSGYGHALGRRGRDAVAVALGAGVRPLAYNDVAIGEAYTASIEHSGDLRRTIKRLRSLGVGAVMAGSPAGVELAERIAWQLRLPGSGTPGSTVLRTDRGAQAEALMHAGIAAPHTLRTTDVAEALAWADFDQASVYQLASATNGVPVEPVNCRTKRQIAAHWPQIRGVAQRHSGDGSLVLRELVRGRQYVVDSVTWLGPDGPQHAITDIWAHMHTPTGLLDRADLLHRHDLLARRLALYVCSVLDTLGVTSGPMSCHVAFEPEHGPVLLSAKVVTHRSRADEAVWEVTGRDPLDAALDSALPACPHGLATRPHRVVRISRIYPNAPHSGVPTPELQQDLAALPTVACVDVTEGSSAPSSASHRPGGGAIEIVLAHEASEAIERDVRCIHALTAGLHRDGGR